MELLTEIRNAIDFLKVKPEEIDVTEISRILSLCHEVARAGLNRSQSADLYRQAKPRLEELEARLPEVETELEKQTVLLAKARVEIDAFNEVLAAMRRDTVGKMELIKSYDRDLKASLRKKIEDCEMAVLLEVRAQTLSDFNNEWNRGRGSEKLVVESGSSDFVDHKLYKTGA